MKKRNNIFAALMSVTLIATSAVTVSAFAEGEETAPSDEITLTAETPDEVAAITTTEEYAVTTTEASTTADITSTTETATTVTEAATTVTTEKTYTPDSFIAKGTWYSESNFEGYKTYRFNEYETSGVYILA